MPRTTCLAPFLTLLVLATIFPIVSSTSSAARRAASYAKYTTAHSLGSAYDFEARDGWSSVNVTNLNYKYRRDAEASSLAPRHPKDSDAHHGKDSHKHDDGDHDGKHDKKKGGPKKAFSASSVGGLVKGVTNSVFKGLKGIGKQEQVKITWYTGHDLQNPSCWANTEWAPTDNSFACALTLDGWLAKPKCFEFLELCQNSDKCVFVRVVDSCAGCAPDSKHVDLTKAAFKNLASIDEGVTMVHMRGATRPDDWFLDLWGPKA